MNIVISGYGKMGKQVEKAALERRHKISAIIDTEEDWQKHSHALSEAAVIIDFSMPSVVVENIKRAFAMQLPIVTGTTAWDKERSNIIRQCREEGQTLFFAPNFSIGVNIFFEVNKYVAGLMSSLQQYDVHIEETHHIEKIDKPSGTAVRMAEDILKFHNHKEKWVNFAAAHKNELAVLSKREGGIIGNHKVIYNSAVDTLTLEHDAKDRKGFAMGAVLAAEWALGKKGYFEMKDMLNFNK